MPANGLPPRPASLRWPAVVPPRRANTRTRNRWQRMAATKPPVATYSTPALPMVVTVRPATAGPTNAPAVPPAAMKPNRRFA